ncbi:MAG: EAL domain-containing protein [Chloroflexi bacterium]|nr:MAG: EAL domain-containing protein [Chloroflexota bacterium]
MATDSGSATIVRAMVELGHSLGLDVVAEGVEEEATRQLLIACQCETGQGFLISRALPARRSNAGSVTRCGSPLDRRTQRPPEALRESPGQIGP